MSLCWFFPSLLLDLFDNEKMATVKWLTWYITEVFRQLLAAQENREGVSSIIWFMYLTNLHCVVNKVIVNDLQTSEWDIVNIEGKMRYFLLNNFVHPKINDLIIHKDML